MKSKFFKKEKEDFINHEDMVYMHNNFKTINPVIICNKYFYFFRFLVNVNEGDEILIKDYEIVSAKKENNFIVLVKKIDKKVRNVKILNENNNFFVSYICGRNEYKEKITPKKILKKQHENSLDVALLVVKSLNINDYLNLKIYVNDIYVFEFNNEDYYYYSSKYEVDIKEIYTENDIINVAEKYIEKNKQTFDYFDKINRKIKFYLSDYLSINVWEIEDIERIKIHEVESLENYYFYDIRNPYSGIYEDVICVRLKESKVCFKLIPSEVDEDYIRFNKVIFKDKYFEDEKEIDFYEKFLGFLYFLNKEEFFSKKFLYLPDVPKNLYLKQFYFSYEIDENSDFFVERKKFLEQLKQEYEKNNISETFFNNDYVQINKLKKYFIDFKRVIDIEEGVGARDNTIIDTSHSVLSLCLKYEYEILNKNTTNFVLENIKKYLQKNTNIYEYGN